MTEWTRFLRWCGVILSGLLMLVTSLTARADSRDDPDVAAAAELRAAVQAIASDAMAANIEGLQNMHLDSEKYSKFGPRSFDRQDVATANATEAAFFSSVKNMKYEVRDLKIDVFDDVGVVTYYPFVSFTKDGESKEVNGRQTLVLLKTPDGWKIIHEHGTIRVDSR